MPNILQMQEILKSIPDQRLMKEMQQPTGVAPTFLVMTELERRNKVRKEYQGRVEEEQTTVVEDMVMPQGGGELTATSGGLGSMKAMVPPSMPPSPMQPQAVPSPMGMAQGRPPIRAEGGGALYLQAGSAATVNFGADDLNRLIKLVEAEAGNQSVKGRRGVAAVILNRIVSGGFPDTIKEVAEARKHGIQFQPVWEEGVDGNVDNLPEGTAETRNVVLDLLVDFNDKNPVGNAVYFQNPAISDRIFPALRKYYNKSGERNDTELEKGVTIIDGHTFSARYDKEPILDIEPVAFSLGSNALTDDDRQRLGWDPHTLALKNAGELVEGGEVVDVEDASLTPTYAAGLTDEYYDKEIANLKLPKEIAKSEPPAQDWLSKYRRWVLNANKGLGLLSEKKEPSTTAEGASQFTEWWEMPKEPLQESSGELSEREQWLRDYHKGFSGRIPWAEASTSGGITGKVASTRHRLGFPYPYTDMIFPVTDEEKEAVAEAEKAAGESDLLDTAAVQRKRAGIGEEIFDDYSFLSKDFRRPPLDRSDMETQIGARADVTAQPVTANLETQRIAGSPIPVRESMFSEMYEDRPKATVLQSQAGKLKSDAPAVKGSQASLDTSYADMIEQIKLGREDAKNMGLLTAGLGIMQQASQPGATFLSSIPGAAAGIKQYGAEKDALAKQQMALATLANQQKLTELAAKKAATGTDYNFGRTQALAAVRRSPELSAQYLDAEGQPNLAFEEYVARTYRSASPLIEQRTLQTEALAYKNWLATKSNIEGKTRLKIQEQAKKAKKPVPKGNALHVLVEEDIKRQYNKWRSGVLQDPKSITPTKSLSSLIPK